MSTVPPPYKKRIGTENYLPFPKIQLKYAGVFTFVVAMGLIFFMIGQTVALRAGENLSIDEVALAALKSSLYTYNIVVIIVALVTTFLVSVLVTHRFLGPIVAIKRSLDHYQKEGTFKKISIRKTDEIHELVDLLNKFLYEKLSK